MRYFKLLTIGVVLFALAACKPSYQEGQVKQTITQICENEYNVEVKVVERDQTIGVLIPLKFMLSGDLTFSEKAIKKLEDVMLTTTRVSLSSEYKFDFFVVSLLDTETGIQVDFSRYIQDIRRLWVNDISRSDFFQRMLVDVQVVPNVSSDPLTNYQMPKYTLQRFLARQIAERFKAEMQAAMVVEKLFNILAIRGDYVSTGNRMDSASEGYFKMTIYFEPDKHNSGFDMPPELLQAFLDSFKASAKRIIRRYGLKEYGGMQMVDGQGNELAFYDKQEFEKGNMSTLMELIKSLKK